MEIQTNGFTPPPIERSISQTTANDIETFLSDFDAQNLTESDAQSIVEQLKESGIQPGKELGNLLNNLGFNPQEIAEKAGIEANERPVPPPLPDNNENQQNLPQGSTFSIVV